MYEVPLSLFVIGRLAIAGSLLLTQACRDESAPRSMGFARVEVAWVTGAAAAAVQADGRIALPAPVAPGPREIGEGAARAQAVAWAHAVATALGNVRPSLEEVHGAPIDFTRLTDCDRAYYVESGFGVVPESAAPWIHNGLGNRWLIRLCDDRGNIPVVLNVAANSDAWIESGQLRTPAFNSGNLFRWSAIKRGSLPLPFEPEAAIGFAYRATGVRTSEVPVLVQRLVSDGAIIDAVCGFWSLTLERQVRGVGAETGDTYETREVRVGRDHCFAGDTALFVARTAQPDTTRTMIYDFWLSGTSTRRDTVRVAVRSPHAFERMLLVTP
jgi:hypothetical protein